MYVLNVNSCITYEKRRKTTREFVSSGQDHNHMGRTLVFQSYVDRQGKMRRERVDEVK